jgi:APA family basic amino acid/polyamine antiporter
VDRVATVARHPTPVHASVAYRRILVPIGEAGVPAMEVACALAVDHGAAVTALAVIEVPAALPLDAHMPEDDVRERLALAEAIGDRHDVRVERTVVRARRAGEAIVEAAGEADSELIVLRAPRLGRTARYVLKHARCRVLLAAPRG